MNNDVMLDIETLGTGPKAVVLSIGAARFDVFSAKPMNGFVQTLDIDEQTKLGRTITRGTFNWWMQQSDDARKAISAGEGMDVVETLHRLRAFCKGAKRVWGFGSDFDNAIVRSLEEDVGTKNSWAYRGNRCFRTFVNLFDPKGEYRPKHPEGFVGHNALHDALYQAQWMREIVHGKHLEELFNG